MSERTLEDYGRAAVALPGFVKRPGMLPLVFEYGEWTANPRLDSYTEESMWMSDKSVLDVDDDGTAGALEPLLGATLVTWDSREDTRGIEVTWGDGDGPKDHVYIPCETKGRGLVLAAEYRGRWDGGNHG